MKSQPCNMGQICLDCQPRGPNGECPDQYPAHQAKIDYLTTALKDLLEMPEYDGTQATAQIRLRAKNQAKRALKAVQHEKSSSLPG